MAFAQEFGNELLRRVPFRGISNHSSIAWLPDSVAYWWPEITEAANNHNVEPELLAIIVTVESCGNPEAGSGVGATGLTQVMPSTGRGIAQGRGITNHTDNKLLDPKYNLDFGAYYLSQQMKAFGNVLDAAGAYNGGPGAMQNFLKGSGALADETESYRTWVGGMYNDRHFDSSSTFKRWYDVGGSVLCKNADVVVAQYPAR
jgi:soluble lytic murein transglycosylase-like protein